MMTRRSDSFVLTLLMAVALMAGCGKGSILPRLGEDGRGLPQALLLADSLMNSRPDSALAVLEGAEGDMAGEHQWRQWQLLRLNVINKLDTLFTAAHVAHAQTLADYFDRHGTANERMLAHYLLGRTYYDTHEAPMALHCYQEAIDCADTTAANCDFALLSRVNGQAADIFCQQGLYRNQIEYDSIAENYAWRGKDTLAALQCYAMKASAYDQLQMKDSAILLFENAIKQFKLYNYNTMAAGFSGILARMLIDKGDIPTSLLHDYEESSGYFDTDGNIMEGREIYYCWKGLYYLNCNSPDSAEYFFRKELREGKDYDNQNSGSRWLARLFYQKGMPDSAAKYALYAYDMNDSVYAQRAMREIEQAKAMYDYTRQQDIAHQEKQKSEKKQRIIWYIVITAGAIVFYMLNRLFRKQKEYRLLVDEHVSMQSEVMQLREHKANYDQLIWEKEEQAKNLGVVITEIENLRLEKNRFDQMLKEKEDKIEQQKADIKKYKRLARQEKDAIKKQLEDSAIYKIVSSKATKGQELTTKEWNELEKLVVNRLPEFYIFVSSREYALTVGMYHVCILVRLQIPFSSIANMMGVKAPTISKMCSVVLKKLFGKEGSGKDLEQELIQFN